MAPLRTTLRSRRNSIPAAEQARRAALVAEQVVELDEWDAATVVAAYQAHDGELDPAPLVARAVAAGKTVVTPAIVGDDMEFREAIDLEMATFGILAPSHDARVFAPAEIDFVVNPLVGFDRFGTRIGRGRGYYDRAFADPSTRPFLCGVAHSEQQVDRLVRNDWDVTLAVVVTEDATIWPVPWEPLEESVDQNGTLRGPNR